MKPDNIILEGVTGSTAYGLATENSDIDIKGVYLLPTREVIKLTFDPQHTTRDHVNPDWVYHELQKFMKLVVGGNPTVNELLWLESYTKLTPIGQMLIDNRKLFLSTKAVDKAYRGYAMGQAERLARRTAQGMEGYDSSLKNRFAKHTRHCFRLLLQCRQLLETGELTVRVTPEQREWLFSLGEAVDASSIVEKFMEEDSKMNNIVSVLPDEPDYDKLNQLLYEIRMQVGDMSNQQAHDLLVDMSKHFSLSAFVETHDSPYKSWPCPLCEPKRYKKEGWEGIFYV